jgi:hypothetical protein
MPACCLSCVRLFMYAPAVVNFKSCISVCFLPHSKHAVPMVEQQLWYRVW